MGGGTDTKTTVSGSTDPNIQTTVDQLLTGVQQANTAGPQVFNQSLYTPAGATTQQSQTQALAAADNPTYNSGTSGAIAYDSALAGGQSGLNDPTYQALRAKAGNDAQTQINQQFNNSGRLGGQSADKALGEGVTNALAGMDYQQYQNGIQNTFAAQNQLPNAYQSSLLPSATVGGVGAAQDANTQGALLGQNDLFTRNANAKTDLLAKAASILGVASPSAPQQQAASTPSTPWYQSVLGAIGAFA